MENKDCLYKIVDYLLGKDFDIVEPVDKKTANDMIYEIITLNYPPYDKSDFILYREKHPNCEYCKYYRLGGPPVWLNISVSSWYECALSDKKIKWPIKARFCKYYKVKNEKES